MKTKTELMATINTVGAEMKTLMQKERTEDEQKKLVTLSAEFETAFNDHEQIVTMEDQLEKAKALNEGTGSVSNLAGSQHLNRSDLPELKTLGARFAETDAVKSWLKNGGKRSEPIQIEGDITKLAAEYGYAIETVDGEQALTRHALVHTGATPRYMVPPQVLPTIYRPRDYHLAMTDVLISATTTADTIYFLRELLYTSAAVEVAQATATTGSSGLKPEASLTFEQASVPVVTIAHWIPITRQAIADAAQLQSYIEDRLSVGLDRRRNSQIVNGDGSGATMTGIFNTTGVQALDDTYFGSDPVTNTGTQLENFERVLRGMTEIDLTGDALATFIAMNPRDLEMFRTIADDEARYLGGGPFVAGQIPTMWGVPIATDRAIPEAQVLLGDGSMGAVFTREASHVMIDTIDDQFIRNMVTLLAELRCALAIFRPVAFAIVDLDV